MAYILDSSSLITPFHQKQLASLALARGWPPDEAQTKLEDFLAKGISQGLLRVAREVHEEVMEGKGPSADFLKSMRGKYKLLEPGEETLAYAAEVVEFVRNHYEPHYENPFADGADPYLLAYARQHGFVLVSEERSYIPGLDNPIPGVNAKIQGPPKLPFLAFVYKVKCISLMTLLVERGW